MSLLILKTEKNKNGTKCEMIDPPSIAEKYPTLYAEARAMSQGFLQYVKQRAKQLPDEGMPYKEQCLLESIITELKKAV
jgi:hypothetical protein